MRRSARGRDLGVALAVLTLSACSASSGGGGTPAPAPTPVPTPAPVPITVTITGDAVRFAKQASFGPTLALTTRIASTGTTAWIDEQLASAGSSYADLNARAVPRNYCNLAGAPSNCLRDYFSSYPVALEFYAHAATGNDQLRQRVAFALSQLIVASDVEVHSTAGLAVFYQLLLDNAFGNYRTLLRAVTVNAYMGDFLDVVDSQKAAPNENYAREFMQLFAVGVSALNADGTVRTDASGAAVANFTADDVHNVARALTGWTYTRFAGASATDYNQVHYTKPMTPISAQYDATAKTFLGVTVPAGASPDGSIDGVVDAIFNNASTPPFVSRSLIRQLVTSNPSAAYVGRITAVFSNNGSGTRGDLKAVIRAILTDPEARGDAKSGARDGKLKEPVLFMLSVARLIGITTDGYAFTTRDAGVGQAPFRAPSVFNSYPPGYPLPLGGDLVSPPTKLLTAASVYARHNFAYDWTIGADTRPEWASLASLAGATGTTAN